MAKQLLETAKRHIFSTGLGDAASHLCQENMKYGLAKMHYVQEKMGISPKATFISAPDETVTRNVLRWEAGISYGGKISWGDGKEDLLVLDVKPNACGMLVGGIESIPKPKELIKKIIELEKSETVIKGTKVNWDFYKGNHFIDIFEVKNTSQKLPKYAALFHAGCPELKGDNEKGVGLYWNKSKSLLEMYNQIKTPFGPIHILTGADLKKYFKFYQYAEEFAKKRREIAFKAVFGGKIISNICHQGLLNPNEIALGCQPIKNKKEIFAISIRADIPSFLVKGHRNFTEEQIESLGFAKRAKELGVYKRLRKANILPHGGGYQFLDSLTVDKVFEINGKRFFEIQMKEGIGKKIILNVRALQFTYRGLEVLRKTEELGLATVIAELMPVYTLKI